MIFEGKHKFDCSIVHENVRVLVLFPPPLGESLSWTYMALQFALGHQKKQTLV